MACQPVDTSGWSVDDRRLVFDGRTLAIDLTLGQAGEQFDAMREFLNQAQELNVQIAAEQDARAASTYRLALAVTSLWTILSAAVGLALWSFLGRRTSRVIRGIGHGLREGAEEVVRAANEMASSSNGLSRGASEQAASLEETSASMEEIGSMSRSTSEHASRASALMAGIRESSRRVSRIVRTIDEIAFQTNILALTRRSRPRGPAKPGRASRSSPTRSAASRSAPPWRHATPPTSSTSLRNATAGSSHVEQVAGSIAGITESVRVLKTLMADVQEASREQARGIAQVSQAVQHMGRTTHTTGARAEEGAAASEVLQAQARETLRIVLSLEALVGTSAALGRSQHVLRQRRLPRRRTCRREASQAALSGRGLRHDGLPRRHQRAQRVPPAR